MKYHHFFYSISLLSILYLFSACNDSSKEPVIYIPSDAHMAIHIDLKSMSGKAENWQTLFSPDNLSKWDVPIESQEAMSKVIQEGLDTESPILVFGKTKKDEYSVLVFRAKDRSIFQEIIEDNDGEFKSADGTTAYYVVLNEGESYAFADGDGILLLNKNGSEEEAIAFYQSLKEITPENALSAKNQEYKSLISQPHEIAFWLDSPLLSNDNLSALRSLGMPGLSKSEEPNRQATGVILFEEGKASLNLNVSLEEDLKNRLEKILSSQSSEAVAKNIPISTPSALLAFSLNMDGLYEVMKAEGQTREMKESSELLGLSEQELLNVFAGNAALNLGQLSLLSLGEGKIKAETILSIPFQNEKAVNKMLEEAVKEGALENKGDFYYTEEEVADLYVVDIFIFTKDKTLYATITEDMKDKIMKGEHTLKGEYTTILKDQGAFLYFDIPQVYDEIGLLGANVFEEVDVKAISQAISSASLGIPALKDGKLQITLDIRTSDKGKNALEVLVDLLGNNLEEEPA